MTTPLVGQAGTLIMDNKGNPIWFRSVPAGQEAFDFQTQTLSGKQIAKITAQNGWTADPHEFRLTSQGTAIFPAVKEVQWLRYRPVRGQQLGGTGDMPAWNADPSS